MNYTIDKLKNALIELTDKSIAEGNGDKKCTSKFFDTVQATNDKIAMLCKDDELYEFLVFSTLLEIAIAKYNILQLNHFLKKY